MEIVFAIAGVLLGVGGYTAYNQRRGSNATAEADKIINAAKNKASDIVLKAKDEAIKTA